MPSKQRKPNSKARLKKAALSFYPEAEAYGALKELSLQTGVPQQVYLRRALDFVLQIESPTKPSRKAGMAVRRSGGASVEST